jgi:hypothetical protein
MPWAVEWYEDDDSMAPTFRGFSRELTGAIRNCVRQAESRKAHARDQWEAVRDSSNIYAPLDP